MSPRTRYPNGTDMMAPSWPFFGDIAADVAMNAIYAGLPADMKAETWTRFSHPAGKDPSPNDIEATGGFIVWSGHIENAVGQFFVPNLLDAVNYARYIRGHNADRMPKSNKGAVAGAVSRLAVVHGEIDKGTVEQQMQKWIALEANTGLRPAVLCLSGDTRPESIAAAQKVAPALRPRSIQPGKSVHGHLCIEAVQATEENIQKWHRAELLLAKALGGDEAVASVHQPMRLPGVLGDALGNNGGVRIQTCIRADEKPMVYTLDDVIGRLEKHLGAEVVADLDAAFAGNGKGKNGSSGSSSAKLPSDTLEPGTIINGKTIEQWGKELGPGGKTPCRCPNPEHGRGRGDLKGQGSAFIGVTDAGTPFVSCPQVCGTTWWPDHGITSPEFEAGSNSIRSVKGDALSKDRITTLKVGHLDRRNERYLSGIWPKTKDTYVRSPRNTGKSTRLREVIECHVRLNADARIVIPVPRISLVTSTLGELDGLGFMAYDDPAAKAGNIIEANRVVITYDSLHKLGIIDDRPGGTGVDMLRPKSWDLVIIDESEQGIRHTDGDTVSKNSSAEKVVFMLSVLVESARHAVWMDADLSDLTIETARKLRGLEPDQPHDEETLVLNEVRIPKAVKMYSSKEALDARRRDLWRDGKMLGIASTTKAEAARIAASLKQERPDAKVMLVTSETSGTDEVRAFLKSPDQWIASEKPDAIVYSPSLGTGVDIAVKDAVDHVLAFVAVGKYTTVFDALQMMERIRNPKDATLDMWVEGKRIDAPTDPDAIKAKIINHGMADGRISMALYKQPDGTVELGPRDNLTVNILTHVRSKTAKGQWWIARDIRKEMTRLGWSITEVTDEPNDAELIRKRINKLKGDIRKAELQAVIDIPTDGMTPESARLVLRSRHTPDDGRRATKVLLLDFTGLDEDDLTVPLVKNWLSGRLAQQVEEYALVRAFRADDKDVLRAAGWRQGRRWNRTAKTRPALLRAGTMAKILDAYQIPALEVGGGSNSILSVKGHDPMTDRITTSAVNAGWLPGNFGSLRDVLGIKVKLNPTVVGGKVVKVEPLDSQDAKPVVAVLRKIGIRPVAVTKSVKVNGKPRKVIQHYTLDEDSVALMERMADRWVERLVDRHDAHEDPEGHAIRKFVPFEDPALAGDLEWLDEGVTTVSMPMAKPPTLEEFVQMLAA